MVLGLMFVVHAELSKIINDKIALWKYTYNMAWVKFTILKVAPWPFVSRFFGHNDFITRFDFYAYIPIFR